MRRSSLVLAAASVALTGCAAEPIVGTWRSTITVLGTAIDADFIFEADHTLVTETRFTYPASAQTYAGCTQVTRGTGTTWSSSTTTEGMNEVRTLTLAPSAMPNVTLERTGCANGADDLPPTPQDPTSNGMTSSGTYTYRFENETLLLTSAGTGMTTVFMRVR